MKIHILFLFLIIVAAGCDKTEFIPNAEDQFTNPNIDDPSQGSDTDDPEFNRVKNFRIYNFAGETNAEEEYVLLAGDDAPVTYSFNSVFIPEGDFVDKENYSLETPIACSVNDEILLFFNRSLDGGVDRNSASGWCMATNNGTEWSAVTEVRKYAPYGYEKDGQFAFGHVDDKVVWAQKGILYSDPSLAEWFHFPESFNWENRELTNFNLDIGGGVNPQIQDTKFGWLMNTESFAKTEQILEIVEIKYDTLDMDGAIPIYGTTPVDTVWAYNPIQNARVPSFIVSDDEGYSWMDYSVSFSDTLHMLKGNSLYIDHGVYEGSIVSIGYDLNLKTLHQAVYKYSDGDLLEDTISFDASVTNITNDMPLGVSTPEIIYNPVNNNVEIIETYSNKLILWSMSLEDVMNGNTEWKHECLLFNRGSRYAEFAEMYSTGSVIDEVTGTQKIYLSIGPKSPSRKAIYCLERDLDTSALSVWMNTTRSESHNKVAE